MITLDALITAMSVADVALISAMIACFCLTSCRQHKMSDRAVDRTNGTGMVLLLIVVVLSYLISCTILIEGFFL